jgi:hypothetical protein
MTLDNAALFRAMAGRIDKNDPAEFAGALLIVPPSGDPIEYLALNPKQDVAAFWGAVQAHVQRALAEMEEKQRDPFGRR